MFSGGLMGKYNFDEIINRKNTNSLKFDFAEKRKMPENIMPLWVADMDFKAAPEIISAISAKTEHGIFGYSEPDESYSDAIIGWYKRRHDAEIEKKWIKTAPGVVFNIAAAIRALTCENDCIIIQKPVYYPFSEVILDNNRRIVNSPLKLVNNRYEMDLDGFEAQVKTQKPRLYIMSNPHNPGGRVWTREELVRVADICLENGVFIIADEIHSDIVFGESKHIAFTSLGEKYAQNCIICNSPSKSFNLAGLQHSYYIAPNPEIRRKISAEIGKTGYGQCNIFGLVSLKAAYTNGESWLEEMNAYVWNNVLKMEKFLAEKLPKLRLMRPEGSYLVWVDFSGLNLSHDEVNRIMVGKAGLWLDEGTMFGKEGGGFQRFNVACPWSILEQALFKLEKAFSDI